MTRRRVILAVRFGVEISAVLSVIAFLLYGFWPAVVGFTAGSVIGFLGYLRMTRKVDL